MKQSLFLTQQIKRNETNVKNNHSGMTKLYSSNVGKYTFLNILENYLLIFHMASLKKFISLRRKSEKYIMSFLALKAKSQ